MAKYIIIVFLLLCVGCSKHTTDTVYLHTTDTLYQSRTLIDRIIERDTVNTYTRGDTVFVDNIKWHTRYVGKTDTVYQSHTDTLWRDRKVIVEKPVERKPTWWEKTQQGGFWVLLGLVAVGVIVWRMRNLRKKILGK